MDGGNDDAVSEEEHMIRGALRAEVDGECHCFVFFNVAATPEIYTY